MKNIIFIALPAAGKGTQSKMLVDKYDFIHISTGDLLRNAINANTELSLKIAETINKGNLVPDEIINNLLVNKLKEIKNKRFILDGYPRNLSQAHYLEKILADNYWVINLKIDYQQAIDRIINRRICPKCNRVYNLSINALKPKKDNICDICQHELVARKDDNLEVVKKRIANTIENIQELLDYYQKNGKLKTINGNDDYNKIFYKIEKLLEE